MAVSPDTGAIVRFADFEVDVREQVLRQNGAALAIQEKPLLLLLALVERPGQLVSREELRNRLWPADAFGAFEDGLNTAMRKLRLALNDSAETPRFIETVPRRGYRFVGELKVVEVHPTRSASLTTIGRDEVVNDEPDGQPVKNVAPSMVTVDHRRRSGLARVSTKWWVAVVAVLVMGAVLAARVRIVRASDRNIRSIAVLPFANMSGDASQDYFADAMTEEMTSDLAKIGALRVISRTSAMHFKGSSRTAPEIARELNVDGVIEGSVLRTGDRVRITAQLINARSDVHLWSDSYERELKDVLALQSELAHSIANEVRAAISPEEEARLRPQVVRPEAYESYLLGRAQLEKWTTSGASEALRYFEHAIELDNRYALPYVGIAECYLSHPGVPGVGYAEASDRAMKALTNAIELRPDMGEPHVILGGALMGRWDFVGAEAEMRKGLAMSPGYGAGHHWFSHLLMYIGRRDESMAEAKKMLELDPLSPAANLHMGYEYEATRQWERAVEQQQKTLRLDPNLVDAHEQLGRDYMGKGMYAEGVAELRRAVELVGSDSDPDFAWHAGELGFALAKSGHSEEARHILARIPKSAPAAASSVYAGLGNKEQSIALLYEAYRIHDVPLDAGFLVQYDSLRDDARFVELLRRVGLR